jgi:hypothetical protein
MSSFQSSSDGERLHVSPDDALPRVEPPNASFIVQLFVLPAAIVAVIVLVWTMFNWLARMGSEPREYLQQIAKHNANSWVAANRLADELRTDPELAGDDRLAQDLGRVLEKSVQAGDLSADAVNLRAFLCQALGKFHVPDGLPALLVAAQAERDADEQVVRRWAVEAIAQTVSNVRQRADSEVGPASTESFPSEMLPTLLAAAGDASPQLRETAAFALGVVGGDQALAKLTDMQRDVHAGVMFNAAAGLARHGRVECVPALDRMLDPQEAVETADILVREQLERLKPHEHAEARDVKRAQLLVNALEATGQLHAANPQADIRELRAAAQKLAEGDLRPHFSKSWFASEVQDKARRVLAQTGRLK